MNNSDKGDTVIGGNFEVNGNFVKRNRNFAVYQNAN